MARCVKSLEYPWDGVEDLSRLIVSQLNTICGHYTSEPVFPRLRRIIWEEYDWVETPDDGLPQYTPLLITLLALSTQVDTLSVTASIPPRDYSLWLRALSNYVSPCIRSLSLQWPMMDEIDPNPDLYASLTPLVTSAGLRELGLGIIHYNCAQINSKPHETIEILEVKCDEAIQQVQDFLVQVSSTFPSLQRLRLCIESDRLLSWNVDMFRGIYATRNLKEFQVLATGPAEGPLLSTADVQTVGAHWKQLEVLNLFSVFDCTPGSLEAFAEHMPNLQKLAVYFRNYDIPERPSSVQCSKLEILCFTPDSIPGSDTVLRDLGAYLASVLPRRVLFARHGEDAPRYEDHFADLMIRRDPPLDIYRAFLDAWEARTDSSDIMQ